MPVIFIEGTKCSYLLIPFFFYGKSCNLSNAAPSFEHVRACTRVDGQKPKSVGPTQIKNSNTLLVKRRGSLKRGHVYPTAEPSGKQIPRNQLNGSCSPILTSVASETHRYSNLGQTEFDRSQISQLGK